MTPLRRVRPRSLAVMAVGAVAAVVLGAQALSVARPGVVGVRVGAPRAAPPAPAAASRPSPAFEGPALPAGVDVPIRPAPWFAHGRWWSVLEAGDGTYALFALAGPEGPWVATGVVVDDRPVVRLVVAVDDDHLVVASSGSHPYRRDAVRVNRFTWHPEDATWRRDPDFPVQVTDGGVPSVQVATTSDGRIWLARLDDGVVRLAHLEANGSGVSAFAPLAGGAAGRDVGAFSLIARGADVQVAWRSATHDLVMLAERRGLAWSVAAHRSWGASGSRSFAAVVSGPGPDAPVLVLFETSLGTRTTNPQAPAVVLVEFDRSRSRESVVALGTDRLNRPVLVVDPVQRRVGVIAAAAPAPPVPGAARDPWLLVEKTADRSDLVFAPGPGQALGRLATASYSALGGAAGGDRAAGTIAIAAVPERRTWSTVQLGGTAPPGSVETVDQALVHDSFDALPIGSGGPNAWFREGGGNPNASIVADGRRRALAIGSNADPTVRTTVCRVLPAWTGAPVEVVATVRAIGTGTADARILTLKGPGGTLAAVRLTADGQLGHLVGTRRVNDLPVGDGAPLSLTVRVDPGTDTMTMIASAGTGAPVAVGPVPLLKPVAAGRAQVCVSPALGNAAARVVMSDLVVRRP